MSPTAWNLLLLFFPAGLGILAQVIGNHSWDQRLIAVGLLLLCIDQARMALLDLEQIAAARRQTADPRLQTFRQITLTTIALELAGFYLATVWLGWGILVVLLSQVWFNALAPIQIQGDTERPVQPRPWGDRIPVLIADGLGMGLVGLWMAQLAPPGIALVMGGLAIAYGSIKYLVPVWQRNAG